MKLRTKLALLFTVVIIIVTGSIAILSVQRESRSFKEELQKQGLILTNTLADECTEAFIIDKFVHVMDHIDTVLKQEHVVYAMVMDKNGKVRAHSEMHKIGEVITDSALRVIRDGRPFIGTAQAGAGRDMYEIAVPVTVRGNLAGMAQIGYSLESVKISTAKAKKQIIVITTGGVIVGILLAFLLSRQLVKPITELKDGANAIARGNFNIKLEVKLKDEIGELSSAFNKMTIHLKTSRDELTEYRVHLETLVEERTAELTKTNEQLQREITERKLAAEEKEKLEAQLQQAQKMEAIGTLAGGIAHDFNNILHTISGYVQLLSMEKEGKEPDSRYLSRVNESVQRAAGLIKRLLIFGRQTESKLRPTDLNQEVIQIHKLLQRTIPKMIDIQLHLAQNLKIINADPIQLEQIMMNLGINAKDAMPDGGKLVFETKNVILDKAYCNAHLEVVPGEYVLASISDTGHGMSKETLEHIFEPFYTTKELGKGTGLGLAMVYGIVKSHGGHIMCYSEPGQGTVFKVYFPVSETEGIEQEVMPKKEAVIRGGHETILLVDDEETVLDLGQKMLRKYGYTTITTESGESAVEIYKTEKGRIDLVILDIGMPGMGGHKCLQELLKIDPEVKVIVASGYHGSGKVKETIESIAAGFIGKPYDLTDMLKKVRELLDQ